MFHATKLTGNAMIEMMNEQYLTEKEAAQRYGYSCSWFARARAQGYGPRYTQLREHGRVLYALDSTDKWFKDKVKDKE